jgi:hypothetical protein
MYSYPIPYVQKSINENRDLSTVPQLNVLYCGDYSSNVRNILPLYETAKALSNVHLTICGGSNLHLENCGNIKVYPRLSYDRVTAYEKEADVLVHLSNLHGSQIPGKIYQYSGTNKPILFILDGEKEALLDTFSCYGRYCFADNTKERIEKALREIKEQTVEYSPVEDFSKKTIAEKIISID